jgi:hypothetical protein
MTTLKTKKDAAGRALYLEFRKDVYTYQMIMTPWAITLENEVVPFANLRRRISTYHPRRNWTIEKNHYPTSYPAPSRDAYGEFEKLELDQARDHAGQNVGAVAHQFNQLFQQGWTLYQRPLAVEFSYEDLANIRDGKTPNGLYRRIERSRKALSWGESLFNSVAVSA